MALAILGCPVGTRPSPEPAPPSVLPSVRGAGLGGRWRQATLLSPVGPEEQRREMETLWFVQMLGRGPVGQGEEARQLQDPRQWMGPSL